MAGLTDMLAIQDPAKAYGLLNFGLALLQSRGDLAPAIGRAGQAGLVGAQSYRNQTNMQRQMDLENQLLNGRMQDMTRNREVRDLPKQFLRAPSLPGIDATGGLDTSLEAPQNQASQGGFDMGGYLNALMGIDPIQAIQFQKSMQTQVPKMETLSAEQALGYVDPVTKKWVQVAQGPSKPIKPESPPTAVQEYQFAQGQGYKGTFDQWKEKNARAAASSNSVINYGSPVPIMLPDGTVGYAQPGNKAGAPPLMMNDPKTGKPLVKPNESKDKPLPEAATKQLVGTRNLQDAVGNYLKMLEGWDNSKMLSPDARAEMGNAYNNMMLQAKEAYNLGVLNGPDYMILQQVVQNPTSPMSALTSNKAMARQASELSRIAKGIEARVLEAHGKTAPKTERSVKRTGTSNGRKVVEYTDGSIEYAD